MWLIVPDERCSAFVRNDLVEAANSKARRTRKNNRGLKGVFF